ncbi:MAG: hypothetical protein EBQ89_11435, partial [Alphaproteobacteria bacterium]|nr:hypothetical protein [Alphaproteobacteria bacterium]
MADSVKYRGQRGGHRERLTTEDETMKTSKTMTAARKFVAAARSAGWRISSRENVVTITKGFTANSREEFVGLDGEYYGILSILPYKGSMWGTDGSGVGGYSAMLHGVFT